MPRLNRWLPFALCLLPGSAATIFVLLAIANGGQLFGLSVDWLLNCSLLAVPLLTAVVIIILAAVTRRNR